MEMKVSGIFQREKKKKRRVQVGLSRDRLTKVMRGEDESEKHDSRIQIQSRLTLLEHVSLSKSSYPIYCVPLCTVHSHPLTLTHTHTHFFTGLSSQYILPYLFSCYLFSAFISLTFSPTLTMMYTYFCLSFQGL